MTERQTTNRVGDRYDVIVIGSGPAGQIAAAAAARSGASVLVVERGEPNPVKGRWFDHERMVAGLERGGVYPTSFRRPVALGVPEALGGGFAVNSGLYHWPERTVLDRWEAGGADIGALLTGRAAVEATLTLAGGDDPSPAAVALRGAADRLGWRHVTLSTWNHAGFDPQGPFLSEAVRRGVEVVSGARVERIEVRGGGARVRIAGMLLPIEATHVVLAAGTLESYRLAAEAGLVQGPGVVDAHPMLKSIIFTETPSLDRPDTVGRVQVTEFSPEIVSGCALDDDWQLAANHPENLAQIASALQRGCRPIAWYTQAAVPGALSVDAKAGQVRLSWQDHPLVARAARFHLSLLRTTGNPAAVSGVGMIVGNDIQHVVRNARLSVVHLTSSLRHAKIDEAGRFAAAPVVSCLDSATLPSSPGVNPQAAVMAFATARAYKIFGVLP